MLHSPTTDSHVMEDPGETQSTTGGTCPVTAPCGELEWIVNKGVLSHGMSSENVKVLCHGIHTATSPHSIWSVINNLAVLFSLIHEPLVFNDVKVKARTDIWGEYSNPYIQGTTAPCDRCWKAYITHVFQLTSGHVDKDTKCLREEKHVTTGI